MLVLAGFVASHASSEQLLTRTYTIADGLASDLASFLGTDRDGYLWIGTRTGLSRFDGTGFTLYHTASGLPNLGINHFLQTRDGTRWVSTNGGGIARLETESRSADGRVFTAFPVGASRAAMRVNLLFETLSGDLLAGTDGGLFRSPAGREDPAFSPIPLAVPGTPDARLQIWSLTEDARGTLWIGTSAGLVRLVGGRALESISVAPIQGADHVWSIHVDGAGRLWIGHERGLVVWIPPRTASRVEAPAGRSALLDAAAPCVAPDSETGLLALPERTGDSCHWAPQGDTVGPQRLRSLLRTPDGTLWMASAAGLIAFDGHRMHVYGERQGLPEAFVTSLAVDPGGDLWFSTVEAGIVRVLRRGFTYWTRADGLMERTIRHIFEGPDDSLYAISNGSYIHRFDGDRWTAVRPNLPPGVGRGGRSTYGAVLVDHTGQWWVGSGEGLFRFPPVDDVEELARIAPLARYTTADGLAGNAISRLYEDARGDLWIASRIPGRWPLTRWRRRTGEFERFGPEQGLPAGNAAVAFADDRGGGLWVGLWNSGLARFDGDRFRFFAPGRGLPAAAEGVLEVSVDGRGGLWATANGRLVHAPDAAAANPEFTLYPELPGAANDRVVGVIGDGRGSLYLRTVRGIARMRPESGTYQILGTGPPFTHLQDAYLDRNGKLWFATRDGVLRYEPPPDRPGRPPQARIEGLRVAGVPRPVPPMGAVTLAPLRLAPDERQIQIDYSALAFGPRQPVRFQVRLHGTDAKWSAPSVQRSVLYAGLGPRRYRFQVRAIGAAGHVSTRPATVAFTISPPVWRRAWFLATLAVALVALLAAAYRLRVRRVVEVERVRTRIAADLHDDLGASLARVSLLSEAARRKLQEGPEAAGPILREIGETSRGLVATAGDIAYSIDPGRGSLNGLVARLRRFAEDLLVDTDIVWRLEVNGRTSGIELSSDQRRHILAILKEALHNAVRHGRPRHLALTLAVRANALSAELVDDGGGFSSGVPSGGEEPPAGHGLRSIRHRAREVGGRLRIDSEPGAGTRLTLEIPL